MFKSRDRADCQPPTRRQVLSGRLPRPQISIASACFSARGIACRSCEDVCDLSAISFTPRPGGRMLPRIDREACTLCGACAPVCPASAIVIGEGGPDAAT